MSITFRETKLYLPKNHEFSVKWNSMGYEERVEFSEEYGAYITKTKKHFLLVFDDVERMVKFEVKYG